MLAKISEARANSQLLFVMLERLVSRFYAKALWYSTFPFGMSPLISND